MEGHEAEVTCVEWCSKDLRLITCGDDLKHRTWRLVVEKSIIGKNDIVGQTMINSDANYFTPPVYESALLVVDNNTKLSLVKRRIFETDENNRNVENQLASIRISNRQAGTEPAAATNHSSSSSSSQTSFPCSPCKMFVSPRKRLHPLTNASPRKLVFSPRKLAIFNSPTSHLPNFVLDEPTTSGPQSASKTSAKKRLRLDWLTTLSRQKKQQPNPQSGSKKSSDPVVRPTTASPRTVRVKRKLDKTCF